jgi:alkylhydroperoxidase family enzyme
MSADAPRIAPLEPPYDPDVAAMLVRWMPPNSGMDPLRLFRTLAVHDELSARMRPLGAGILGRKARVEPRLREVMIHRTCALTGAEYEWGVHAVAFGRPLGFTDGQLASTVHGSADDPCWSRDEALVFRLADELHATSGVSDELFASLRDGFAEDQILELVITAGWYHTIGYVINACGIVHEAWAERFPTATAAG